VGRVAKLGWALIALAGALSISIVAFEIVALVADADVESSETLPVVGFVPPLGD
jgi:hypothetical protein